jgi:hypothetical protein
MAKRYPISFWMSAAEAGLLLAGVTAEAVVAETARVYARPGPERPDDFAAIEENLRPVLELVAYDAKNGRLTVTDEDYEHVVRLAFRISRAWAGLPPWSRAEVRTGSTSYHLLRDKLAAHLGAPLLDNAEVLGNMRSDP